jgi:hypothetical protein
LDVVETLRSALQDRYAIERELGQGGMATVYRFSRGIEVAARSARIAENERRALDLRPW